MAAALRPIVLLMLLASVLFVVDGVLDGAYPWAEEPGARSNPLAYLTYVFAVVNAGLAYVIGRGSERSLIGRIGLSAFFLLERPATIYALGPKSMESIYVHLLTALIELVILVGALRVWLLGRSLTILARDMDAAFAIDTRSAQEIADAPSALPRRSRPRRSRRATTRRCPCCEYQGPHRANPDPQPQLDHDLPAPLTARLATRVRQLLRRPTHCVCLCCRCAH